MDPFDLTNANKDIDAFYCKFSYMMESYNLYSDTEINEGLDKTIAVIKNIEKEKNKKIFDFNKLKLFPIFVDRQRLYEFMSNFLDNKQFK